MAVSVDRWSDGGLNIDYGYSFGYDFETDRDYFCSTSNAQLSTIIHETTKQTGRPPGENIASRRCLA